jgi:rod shape-determining protein MreD
MPRIVFAILIVVLAFLQTTVVPMGRIIGITPDLVLVTLFLWSALREPREGLLWAFGIGIFIDLLTLTPLGTTALGFLPVAVIGWLGRGRFFQSGLLFPLLMTLVATIAHGFTVFILTWFLGLLHLAPTGATQLNLLAAARLAILGAFLNAVVVPPLYLIVQLLNRWIGRNDSYARA